MNCHEKNVTMLTGSLYRNILLFTIPIALSSMLQQLFNAADTAIVEVFDTSSALAAVGTTGEIIALIVSLSSGLSIGVNVLMARQIGQHKMQHITSILQTSMLLAVMLGIIGLITGQAVIQHACLRMMRILFFEPLCSLYEIPSGFLRGTGHSLYPAIAAISGTCCFCILWICTMFRQSGQLRILYYAFPFSWVLTICLVVLGIFVIKP